jgi:hypothetical protein
MNRQGKTRMAKYYVPYEDEEKRTLESETLRIIIKRPKDHTHFVEVKFIFNLNNVLFFVVS